MEHPTRVRIWYVGIQQAYIIQSFIYYTVIIYIRKHRVHLLAYCKLKVKAPNLDINIELSGIN